MYVSQTINDDHLNNIQPLFFSSPAPLIPSTPVKRALQLVLPSLPLLVLLDPARSSLEHANKHKSEHVVRPEPQQMAGDALVERHRPLVAENADCALERVSVLACGEKRVGGGGQRGLMTKRAWSGICR